MQIDQSKKCAHEGCQCLAEKGQDYCSASCKNAAADARNESRGVCNCGHAGCTAAGGSGGQAAGSPSQ